MGDLFQWAVMLIQGIQGGDILYGKVSRSVLAACRALAQASAQGTRWAQTVAVCGVEVTVDVTAGLPQVIEVQYPMCVGLVQDQSALVLAGGEAVAGGMRQQLVPIWKTTNCTMLVQSLALIGLPQEVNPWEAERLNATAARYETDARERMRKRAEEAMKIALAEQGKTPKESA